MEETNYGVPTCEECYDVILDCIDRMEEKYGYEYLGSWITKEGVKVTVKLLESLPIEMLVYKTLNDLECTLAGETGIVPCNLCKKIAVAISNAMKLIAH